jgi:hypothetical protein
VSFVIAATMALKLPSLLATHEKTSSMPHINIFSLFRSVFPVFISRVLFLTSALTIFNAVIFALIPKNYGLHISFVGIIYSIVGVSSVFAGVLINTLNFNNKKILFCFGNIAYICGAIIFGYMTNIYIGLLGCICIGIGNALQKIGSRSSLRDLLSSSEYNRIISVDYFTTKFFEILITFAIIHFVSSGVSISFFIQLCCFLMFILCPMTVFWTSKKSLPKNYTIN